MDGVWASTRGATASTEPGSKDSACALTFPADTPSARMTTTNYFTISHLPQCYSERASSGGQTLDQRLQADCRILQTSSCYTPSMSTTDNPRSRYAGLLALDWLARLTWD